MFPSKFIQRRHLSTCIATESRVPYTIFLPSYHYTWHTMYYYSIRVHYLCSEYTPVDLVWVSQALPITPSAPSCSSYSISRISGAPRRGSIGSRSVSKTRSSSGIFVFSMTCLESRYDDNIFFSFLQTRINLNHELRIVMFFVRLIFPPNGAFKP